MAGPDKKSKAILIFKTIYFWHPWSLRPRPSRWRGTRREGKRRPVKGYPDVQPLEKVGYGEQNPKIFYMWPRVSLKNMGLKYKVWKKYLNIRLSCLRDTRMPPIRKDSPWKQSRWPQKFLPKFFASFRDEAATGNAPNWSKKYLEPLPKTGRIVAKTQNFSYSLQILNTEDFFFLLV